MAKISYDPVTGAEIREFAFDRSPLDDEDGEGPGYVLVKVAQIEGDADDSGWCYMVPWEFGLLAERFGQLAFAARWARRELQQTEDDCCQERKVLIDNLDTLSEMLRGWGIDDGSI